MKTYFNILSLDKQWNEISEFLGVLRHEFAKSNKNDVEEDKKSQILRNVEDQEPAGHESMLGSLLFDTLFGGGLAQAFSDAVQAPAWAENVDWGQALEVYDKYAEEQALLENSSAANQLATAAQAASTFGMGSYAPVLAL